MRDVIVINNKLLLRLIVAVKLVATVHKTWRNFVLQQLFIYLSYLGILMWEVFSAGASPYATMGNSQVVNYVCSLLPYGFILRNFLGGVI